MPSFTRSTKRSSAGHPDVPQRRTSSRRTAVVAFIAGAVVAAAVGAMLSSGDGAQQRADAAVELTTVNVEARTLRTHVTYDGTLETGTTANLTAGRSGTVTEAATPGAVLESGSVLVRVDDEPVAVLYGSVPMYRSLESGDEGTDVTQLETFLAVGGYDAATPITVDQTFTSSTATALQNWQEAAGAEVTGVLAAGSFVVVGGPAEILEVAAVGDAVRDGAALASVSVSSSVSADIVDGDLRPVVLTTTPSTPTIELSVVPDELDNFAAGDVVEVESADGETHAGTVFEIGSVAVSEGDGAAGVSVVIVVDAAQELLAGPAEVRIVEFESIDAVAVPTRSLVALAEGGQAVEVADGDARRLVGVELGIFADGWVEITADTEGGALAPGTAVVVPT